MLNNSCKSICMKGAKKSVYKIGGNGNYVVRFVYANHCLRKNQVTLH